MANLIPPCLAGLKFVPSLVGVVGLTDSDGKHGDMTGHTLGQLRSFWGIPAPKKDQSVPWYEQTSVIYRTAPMANCQITISETSFAWRQTDDQCYLSQTRLDSASGYAKGVCDGFLSKKAPILNVFPVGAKDWVNKRLLTPAPSFPANHPFGFVVGSTRGMESSYPPSMLAVLLATTGCLHESVRSRLVAAGAFGSTIHDKLLPAAWASVGVAMNGDVFMLPPRDAKNDPDEKVLGALCHASGQAANELGGW